MVDIARIAGVSAMTVSRALRHPERVSSHALEAIRQAIAATGYVPNPLAQGLASNRTSTIAAIIPIISQPFATALHTMSDSLRTHGYQLLLGVTHYDLKQEENVVRSLLMRHVDGIALFFGGHSRRTREMLAESAVPSVEMWGETSRAKPMVDLVGFRQRSAARDAVTHLVERGRRRIAFIGGPLKHNQRARMRRRGFIDGLELHGMEVHPERFEEANGFVMDEGARAFQRLVERAPSIDAICVTSDLLAIGAVAECHRREIAIPSDIAIVGFDNSEIAQWIYPSLTSVDVSMEDMGRQSAELLVSRLAADSRVNLALMPPRVVDLDYRIVQRDST